MALISEGNLRISLYTHRLKMTNDHYDYDKLIAVSRFSYIYSMPIAYFDEWTFRNFCVRVSVCECEKCENDCMICIRCRYNNKQTSRMQGKVHLKKENG